MQHLEISGSNDSKKFQASFDYYYSDKNYISNNNKHDNDYKGDGYGLDIEYIYNKDKLYIYGGLYNVGGVIYWKGISKMHYDLDSQTTYQGSDGYSHLRAFGRGQYTYNTNYAQKLPLCYGASINYEVFDYLSIGNNLNGYKSTFFNELYLNGKFYNNRYKLGYIYEVDSFIFAAYFQQFSVEISNKFAYSEKIMQARFHFWF